MPRPDSVAPKALNADQLGEQTLPLLSVEGLDKSFFATHAAQDVSFHDDQGEIVALLG